MSTPQAIKRVDSTWFWPVLFVGYFVFQTLYRTLMGGALGLDEAQILLDAQEFRLGYGPQLPLYAWLQRLVFFLTGSTILGLALAKNILLCGLVLTLYFTLRTQYPPRLAGLAAASLLFLPQISWENQRALTHSVLVNFSAVVTFGTVWWIARRPSLAGFVVFGIVLAVGGLSKYNFVLMPLAILLAGATLAETRKPLWSPKLVISLLIAAALLALPVQWLIENPDQAWASANKFRISDAEGTLASRARGIGAALSGAIGFVGLLLVVAGILYWRFGQPGDAQTTTLERLLNRTIAIGLALVLLAMVISGSTQIRERWLQPILIFAAPALILWLVPRLSEIGVKWLMRTLVAVACLIALGLPVHNMQGRAYRAAPFETITSQITADLAVGTTVLAPTWLAGNIRYFAPDTPVVNADFPKSPPRDDADHVLVWPGKDIKYGQAYLASISGANPHWALVDHSILRAPYRFAPDQKFSVSVARVVVPSE